MRVNDDLTRVKIATQGPATPVAPFFVRDQSGRWSPCIGGLLI